MPSIWLTNKKPAGECVICGKTGQLEARCSRCGKWACDKEDCLKLIKEPGQCKAAPIKKERKNGTGDRLAAGQRMD